jgi:hypothetical protein
MVEQKGSVSCKLAIVYWGALGSIHYGGRNVTQAMHLPCHSVPHPPPPLQLPALTAHQPHHLLGPCVLHCSLCSAPLQLAAVISLPDSAIVCAPLLCWLQWWWQGSAPPPWARARAPPLWACARHWEHT